MRVKFLSFILVALFFWIAGCNSDSNPKPETEKPIQKVEDHFAFPGSEGFGMNATGGRGGKVIFVTNLNDSGPGSFRFAAESSGARYVIFRVSGNISLLSKLTIANPNITMAGQTAPGDGICIKDYPVVIAADNVIVRYMRFRLGDEAKQEADALECRFHKNVVIDHCSMSWSTDECVSFYGNENTTVQWCLIGESLRNSVHLKGAHGYGGIWGGKNASFHHNLLAHHDSRNPRLGEEAGNAFALTDLVDLRNNVIYNWGNNSCYGGEAMNANIVKCYYKPGPVTTKVSRIIAIDKNLDSSAEIFDVWGKFFIDGNYMEGSTNATTDNWTYGVYNQYHSNYVPVSEEDKIAMRLSNPLDIHDNVTTHSALIAYEKVLNYAGANLIRDAVDLRIVANVRNRDYTADGSNGSTKGIIDSQADVGGWPELKSTAASLDTDEDGMPDAWEVIMKIDPAVANANGKDLSSAYDNIEVYLHSIIAEKVENQMK